MLQLHFIRCTACGKSTLADQYELSGCSNCHDKSHGVDYNSFKAREPLNDLGNGPTLFNARYIKSGRLCFKSNMNYVLVENIRCRSNEVISNHAFINNVSANTMEQLKSVAPGTIIQFKASTHKYNNKWGLHKMHHLIVVGN